MKKITMFMATICLALCLTACTFAGSKNYTDRTSGRFIAVPMQTDLYYDTQTKVVYVIFNEYAGNMGYGYMSSSAASCRRDSHSSKNRNRKLSPCRRCSQIQQHGFSCPSNAVQRSPWASCRC